MIIANGGTDTQPITCYGENTNAAASLQPSAHNRTRDRGRVELTISAYLCCMGSNDRGIRVSRSRWNIFFRLCHKQILAPPQGSLSSH